MSIKLMTTIWDNGDPFLSGSRLLVMLCLADHANDAGVCWPSIARLAERSRIDRRNVMRHVKELERVGYLKIRREKGRPNQYTVRSTSDASATSDASVTSGKSVTGSGDAGVTGVVTPAPPEPSLNPHLEPPSNRITADDFVDTDLRRAIEKWKLVFANTPQEGNAPVANLISWMNFSGPDVLFHMIEQAKEKRNPKAWLWQTYDNWRQEGEVAPYVQKAVANGKKPAPAELKVTHIIDLHTGKVVPV